MNSLFECDMEDKRLAMMGIVFICPYSGCSLWTLCPYAARSRNEKGGAK